jgi:hypothetical protein
VPDYSAIVARNGTPAEPSLFTEQRASAVRREGSPRPAFG